MLHREEQRYKAEFSRLEMEYSACWKECPLNPEKLSTLMKELVRLDRMIKECSARSATKGILA